VLERKKEIMIELYDFIAKILSSLLSWPVAVFLVALLFRKKIGELLPRIQCVEVPGVKLELEKLFTAQKEQIEAVKKEHPQNISDQEKDDFPSFIKEVELIANISPPAAIPFAYSQIENTIIRGLADGYQSRESEKKFAQDLPQDLFERRVISKDFYRSFIIMKNIKDMVLWNKGTSDIITKQNAIDYGKSAETLIELINVLKEN
jgi:hypothetical protein